ncbi:MAG: sugar phosphate isomerase/epimerase family protein [Paludibacter sp.]
MTTYKYGAHQFLWTEYWTDNSLYILEEVRLLGLDSFEISLGDDITFNSDTVKRRAMDLDIELTVGPGNIWPMECDISSEKRENQLLGLEWHTKIIQKAANLGAVAYNGAIYSHPGNILPKLKQSSDFDRIAHNLYKLATYADRLNIKLVIEPMSRFRTHLVHTAQDAIDLITLVKHPNLYVNLDTYHMVTEERDYAKAIKSCGSYLWGIHACESDRGVPGGGLVPWDEVFSALSATCPNSRILMETYNTGENGYGFKRGIFQNVCPDANDFVTLGLSFLKGKADELKLNKQTI